MPSARAASSCQPLATTASALAQTTAPAVGREAAASSPNTSSASSATPTSMFMMLPRARKVSNHAVWRNTAPASHGRNRAQP